MYIKIVPKKFDTIGNVQFFEKLLKTFPLCKTEYDNCSASLLISVDQKYDCDVELLIDEMNKRAQDAQLDILFELKI